MTVQIIHRNDQPEWAVIPYQNYIQLLEKVEMLQDIQDYDLYKAARERGEEELFPAEVINAILEGENAVKVWREYRGISQPGLASQAGISVPYLSQLEQGRRKGSLKVMSALAAVLKISLDLLVPSQPSAGTVSG